jgi:hypothetical protein
MKSNPRKPLRTAGRRHPSQHEIDSILRSHRLSGLSLLVFAQEHSLRYATLLLWRSRICNASDSTAVQPSAPAPAPSHTPSFIPTQLAPSPTDA